MHLLTPQPDATPTQDTIEMSGKDRLPKRWHWHLFCQVIDNWGDIGVTWRLATDLASHHQSVTVWLDDTSARSWMAPHGAEGIQIAHWPHDAFDVDFVPDDALWPHAPTVVVEMFGCHLSHGVQQRLADMAQASPTHLNPLIWLNLEYLSAEPHVQGLHKLPSPVMSGPAAGMTKWFFYPGFAVHTGGLVHPREEATAITDAAADLEPTCSLFCYLSSAIGPWVSAWQKAGCHVSIWPGAGAAAAQTMNLTGIEYRSAVSQREFDAQLSRNQFNVVRGEDSLTRALWSNRPFIWHIYPQADGAHLEKLEAFLDWAEAPEPVRRAHHIWNGFSAQPDESRVDWVPTPLSPDWSQWLQWAHSVRAKAIGIPNLTLSLLDFVCERAA